MATVFCKKENIRGIKPERVGYVGELKDNLRNGKRATFLLEKSSQIPENVSPPPLKLPTCPPNFHLFIIY